MTSKQAKFEAALTKWRTAQAAHDAVYAAAALKYGPHVAPARWTVKEQKARDRTGNAVSKALSAFFRLLEDVSPRRWSSGVSIRWIQANITWDMATTSGPIPQPEPAMGWNGSDMWVFARTA